MKVLGVVPARGGSKGIPKKNIVEFQNRPLISHTIEQIKNSSLESYLISTDDYEIKKIVEDLGGKVHNRPETLAQDDSSMLDVIKDVLKHHEGFDFLMILQPTSCFRRAFHIDEVLKILQSNPDIKSLVSVCEVPHNFSRIKQMDIISNGLLANNNSLINRQKFNKNTFARNGAFYVTKPSIIEETGKLLSDEIHSYLMDKISSIDIDDYEDLKIARLIAKGILKSN